MPDQTDRPPGLSQWCAQETITMHRSTETPGVWEDVQVSGHAWCAQQRWHDEYHGKDPGCCASDDERESWACVCRCHESDRRARLLAGITADAVAHGEYDPPGEARAATPEALTGDAEYWITVSVPARLGDEMLNGLFTAVADAVHEWEPDQRDGWDADVIGSVEGDVPPPEAQPCRPVDLPDGTTVRVQGMPPGEPPAELTDALADVAETVRRNHASQRTVTVDMPGVGTVAMPAIVAATMQDIAHAISRQLDAEQPAAPSAGATLEQPGTTPPGRSADEASGSPNLGAASSRLGGGSSADEVREAIAEVLATAPNRDCADALMDRVVGPLIAERDQALTQAATAATVRDYYLEAAAATAATVRDHYLEAADEQRQRAERAERDAKLANEAFDDLYAVGMRTSRHGDRYRLAWQSARRRAAECNDLRATVVRLGKETDDLRDHVAVRDATITELRTERDRLREELGKAEHANKDGREAVARVRELHRPDAEGMCLGELLTRHVDCLTIAALDGTDQEATDAE